MKQPKLNLEGSKISLRILRFSDAFDIYINIRDKEVGKWTGPPEHPYLENPLGRFICKTLRHMIKGLKLLAKAVVKPKNETTFRFAIVPKEIGRAIGVVSLTKINPHENTADLGFWIGKKYWGKGLASEAVKLALNIGFNQLGLDKITAWTFEANAASRKVMEKCGFKFDGIVKSAYLKYNEMQNRLNYRILKNECESVSGQ